MTRTFLLPAPGTDAGSVILPVSGDQTLDLHPSTGGGEPPPAEKSSAESSTGRYRVGGELGRGGVGVVHEGWDVKLEREVALKVLLEQHRGTAHVVRRFQEEARITSRLQHPGIVAVHGVGVTPDDRPYFVMQLIRGQTLDQILRHRENATADLPRLLGIFLQICQAVAYAHYQGVIHRDLKPANIMVGAFGVVKVTDWGLAKVLGEPDLPDAMAAAQAANELAHRQNLARVPVADPNLPGTRLGTVFGTPAYLPPEQARGEIDRIDKRGDVFGLGSILCEIITGEPPYTGADGQEIYHKAANAEIADAVGRVNASPVSLDLITLTKWCLSPELGDRPADAAGVVEVMAAYLQADQRRAEHDLVLFFDLSLDLFCIASTDGYFLRVNENFPRVLGYTADELKSRPFLAFVHPDDRAQTAAECDRIATGEPGVQFMNRYQHARGHYLWFEWNSQAVPGVRAIYAVARDVTERVTRAEAHRREEQSRLHLAAVVDSAALAIYSTTPDGIVQSWNRGAVCVYGYRAEEIVGRSILLIFRPGREGEGEGAEILNCVKHGEVVQHSESVRFRKDGTAIHISLTISPVRDEAGHIIGASRIAYDITDRKNMEAALRDREARLRAVVDTAIEAIVTIDAAGTIESLNRSGEAMFGYSAAEIVGQNIRQLMPPQYRERHDAGMSRYLRTGVCTVIGTTVELEGRRKDASSFPMELSISELRLPDRRLFTGVIRDITARKQSEAGLAERLRAAVFISATGTALTRGVCLRAAFQECTELAVTHLDVAFARVWTLNDAEQVLELQASAGRYTHLDGPHSRIPVGKYKIGRIAEDRKPHLTNAVVGDPRVSDQAWAIREGMVAFAGHPLVVGDRVVGVMAVFARHPLSDNIIETLHSVSDTLALAIRRQQLEDELRDVRAALAYTLGATA